MCTNRNDYFFRWNPEQCLKLGSPVSHEWKNYFYIIFFVVLVECYTFLIYLVLTSLRKYFALDISRSSLLCESPQLTYFRYKECTNLNMNCFPQHNLIIINTISSSSPTQYHHHQKSFERLLLLDILRNEVFSSQMAVKISR